MPKSIALILVIFVFAVYWTSASSRKRAKEHRAIEAAEEALLQKALTGKTVKAFTWISSTDMEITFTDGTKFRIDARKYRPDVGFPEFHKSL